MPSLKMLVSVATLAALTTAELVPVPSCTTTLTPSVIRCAGPAGHTSTSYLDCSGCSLFTPYPSMCDLVRCASATGIVADRTTTLTTCAASITPYVRRQEVVETEGCLTLATKTTPGCQDCGATTFATTRTTGVECGGCALQTVDFEVAGPCVCATATTIMQCLASPTIS